MDLKNIRKLIANKRCKDNNALPIDFICGDPVPYDDDNDLDLNGETMGVGGCL
jgi:hypothetical protein